MNREIKFRAYHKSRKEVFRVLSIDFIYEQAEIISFSALDEYESFTVSFDEVELIQYTGLEDKNGVEICEGDILKFYNDEDYILKPGYGEVIFEFGAFCLEHFKYGDAPLHDFDIWDMDISVAGNIYEDGHLLEE